MKKILLLIAIVCTYSFAMAGTAAIPKDLKFKFSDVEKPSSFDVSKATKIDFKTFTEKFDLSKIDKSQIVFTAYGSFYLTDSCGNQWVVEYWGMSFADAAMIVFQLDSFLCWYGAN